MKRGYFVAFEGPEGAGKSTQLRLLADGLRAAGFDIVATREPGGTLIGERIRSILLDRASLGMAAETEALLITAARAQHVRDVIQPALERGAIVLCDRFADSTLAYQGGGRGLPLDALRALQRFAIGDVVPDVRILLDIPAEDGLARRHGDAASTNRLDHEEMAFHRRVRGTFLELASEDAASWVVVDASRPADAIAEELRAVVLGRLGTAGMAGMDVVSTGISG